MPGMSALLLDHIDDAARRIGADDFAGDQASVDVHLVGSSAPPAHVCRAPPVCSR